MKIALRWVTSPLWLPIFAFAIFVESAMISPLKLAAFFSAIAVGIVYILLITGVLQ